MVVVGEGEYLRNLPVRVFINLAHQADRVGPGIQLRGFGLRSYPENVIGHPLGKPVIFRGVFWFRGIRWISNLLV
jgi:hypothetical protein